MKTKLILIVTLFLLVFEFSCTKQLDFDELENILNLPDEPHNYHDDIGYLGIDTITTIKTGNYINNNLATLGRVLFYDKNLSLNRTTSCASCHKQENAFGDTTAFSKGFSGELTEFNTLPLFNIGAKKDFFWTGPVKSDEYGGLMDLSIKTFTNATEMGMEDSDAVVKRVKKAGYYKPLFEKAIPSGKIYVNPIKWAIREFLISISSTNSKFDYARANNFENFSQLELDGFNIFKNSQCNNCHYLDKTYWDGHNNGLTSKNDNCEDCYAPNLRNIVLTAPYMHDGRFATLEEVVDHYSTDIVNNPELSVILKEKGVPVKFNFTEYEKEALIAFLNTLTDEVLISDEKFSDPFIR